MKTRITSLFNRSPLRGLFRQRKQAEPTTGTGRLLGANEAMVRAANGGFRLGFSSDRILVLEGGNNA